MAGRTGYAQLSNGLWLNDKANELLDADPRAFGMWVMSLSYASDNMTDGVLNARALRRLGCDDRTRESLIACGMWEDSGDDCVHIHDYLEHNMSRAFMEESRAKAAAKKRRQRGTSPHLSPGTSHGTSPGTDAGTERGTFNQNQNQKENQNINNPCCCSIDDSNNARAVSEENNNNDDDSPQPSETTIPPDWKPDPEDARYAMLWRLDPRKTGRAFRDYHLRHGTKSHDWHATFRGWVQRNPEAKQPPDSS